MHRIEASVHTRQKVGRQEISSQHGNHLGALGVLARLLDKRLEGSEVLQRIDIRHVQDDRRTSAVSHGRALIRPWRRFREALMQLILVHQFKSVASHYTNKNPLRGGGPRRSVTMGKYATMQGRARIRKRWTLLQDLQDWCLSFSLLLHLD
jgi:hypothetical protein